MVNDKVKVGAQNVSKFGPGAYTGEVSADHLKDYDISWVLIGNSERRTLFNETSEVKLVIKICRLYKRKFKGQ